MHHLETKMAKPDRAPCAFCLRQRERFRKLVAKIMAARHK